MNKRNGSRLFAGALLALCMAYPLVLIGIVSIPFYWIASKVIYRA